jgi:hypothetical protein
MRVWDCLFFDGAVSLWVDILNCSDCVLTLGVFTRGAHDNLTESQPCARKIYSALHILTKTCWQVVLFRIALALLKAVEGELEDATEMDKCFDSLNMAKNLEIETVRFVYR